MNTEQIGQIMKTVPQRSYQQAREVAIKCLEERGGKEEKQHGFKKDFCRKAGLSYTSFINLFSPVFTCQWDKLLLKVILALDYQAFIIHSVEQDQLKPGELIENTWFYIWIEADQRLPLKKNQGDT